MRSGERGPTCDATRWMSEKYSGLFFFFSSRRRHTRSLRDWSSDVCSSDLYRAARRQQFRTLSFAHDCTVFANRLILHRGKLFPPRCASGFPIQTHLGRISQRSEERRVGKECRSRWSAYHSKKKTIFMIQTI